MNKFKKILLGALSALTLGLFVVSGTKVIAGSVTEECNFNGSISNDFYSDVGSYKSFDYTDTSILPSNNSSNANYTKCVQTGCSFTVENSWTGKILFKNINKATKTITVNLNDGSKNTKVYDSSMTTMQVATADISGAAGSFTINGGSNFGLYEIYVTYEEVVATTKTFTLNYDANGGTGTMSADTNTESLDATSSTFTIKTNNFTREGFNFLGWSTIEGATETNVTGDTYTITSGTEATLYAVWEQDTSDVNFTLNFDANGGTSGTITSITSEDLAYTTTSYEFNIGSDATPTRDNYTFLGWATTNTATVAEYSVGGTYTAASLTSTLYAVWEKQAYIISSEIEIEFNTLDIDEVEITAGSLYSNKALKFGSDTKVTFNTSKDFILTLKTDKEKWSLGVKVDGTNLSFNSSTYETSVFIKAGEHTIQRVSSDFRLYSMSLDNPLSDNTTAAVFAEKNSSGDTLRFIGTLTGITDLSHIDTIELILKKGGIASKSQIFLTTCYTSVKGASIECPSSAGTYYVIFRLTGITGVTGTFSKQLKITFTDGSTTFSNPSEIELN